MEDQRSKCKDCGKELDYKKHEWFYCPACWEKRYEGDSSPNEKTVGDSGRGILKLIEALGGQGEGPLPEGNPDVMFGDTYWFQSPLVKAALQGKRPKGVKQWATFFWNIDFFIGDYAPVGKILIFIILLLSLLF